MLEILNRIEPYSSLGLRLEALDSERAVISMPLDGNRNDKGTGFAGSLYSALVLAGWCLTMKTCADRGDGPWEAMIKGSQVSFLRPVASDCRAVARFDGPPEPKGKGRWKVAVTVAAFDAENRLCAEFHGDYRGFSAARPPADRPTTDHQRKG
ncbi:MAG: YiiD C-terminal domain-containing protein [Deltaproteobacteria bacterium]|nr:YiiD C-terminal domain-containing protein [Deltaproteobacteria bacterium]